MDTIISDPISVDSLIVLPVVPREGEVISLYVATTHSSSPCGLLDYNVVMSSSNSIYVTSRYWEGMLTAICHSVDKMVIGKLVTGHYVLNFMNKKKIEFTVYPKDSCKPDFSYYFPKCADSAKCGVNSVSFKDESAGNPVKWHWNFGDTTFSTLQNPMHTYKTGGLYNVCLTISCGNSWCGWGVECLTKPVCKLVSVGVPCKANFSYEVLPDVIMSPNDSSPAAPFPSFLVRFKDLSTGLPTKWYWNFGDGSVSSDQYPVHRFRAGKFAVTLTIETNNSCSSTFTDTLIFTNPTICQYTGTVKDYSGTDGCKFIIELDNGLKLEPVIVLDSFVFRDNQRVILDYEVIRCATTCMVGMTSRITCIKEIPAPVCKAYFTYERDLSVNCICYVFRFSDNSIGNAVKWHWDFGDGTTSDLQNPLKTFWPKPGSLSYNVCLTITTSDSCTSSYCETVFVGTQVPWIPVIGGEENHSIMVSQYLNSNLNLEIGDYIGLFFRDYFGNLKCGGMIRWEGKNDVLIAWANNCMNDSGVTLHNSLIPVPICKNGFYSGEKFQYKIWKWRTNEEILVNIAKYTVNKLFPDSGNFKPDGLSLLSGISTCNKQIISLFSGWNMMSLNVQPDNPAMSSIFGNHNVIVKNYKGEIVYFPQMEIKEGMWSMYEGYKVKAFDSIDLKVSGIPIYPQTLIPLNGTKFPNFLPYYYDKSFMIKHMMLYDISNIRYVQTFEYKNGVLHALNFIPKYGIDQIVYMKPGLAYKLSEYVPRRSFIYPPEDADFINTKAMNISEFTSLIALPEYENNRILVITEEVLKISAGSIVEAYTKNGELVGTEISDGGNLALSMWNSSDLNDYDEFMLVITNKIKPVKYDLSFSKNTTQDEQLYILENVTTGIIKIMNEKLKVKAFPTVADEYFNLDITLDRTSNLEVSVINLMGKVIKHTDYKNFTPGTHPVKVDVSNLLSGQYIYQVKTNTSIARGKIQVNR
jgi:PKD repeat protein